MTLTPSRRRKNRSGLWDVLGVPPNGTLAHAPTNPHWDNRGGVGFLDVAGELFEMDVDVLEELTDDVVPRNPRYGVGPL